MTSKIVVNNIEADAGINTVTISGDVTATNVTGTHHGSAANLTSIPAGNLSGTLPALDGSALTGVGIGTDGSVNTTGIITATTLNYTGNQNLSHRNIIINGAMNVAERGTSSTSTGYQTVDRFKFETGGTDEAPTQAQVDVASGTTPFTAGFRKAFKITNGNQTGGAGTGDRIIINYFIEAQDIANSGWNYTDPNSFITLSFYVKSSVAQTFYVRLESKDGTRSSYPLSTGSLSADTWTKVTHSVPGHGSLLQFDNDTATGLQIEFTLYRGTNNTSNSVTLNAWGAYVSAERIPDVTTTWFTTNDATFELTGVQLEVGPVATPFEHRSFGDELRRCQRYYYQFEIFPSQVVNFLSAYGSTYGKVQYSFPVTMRANPSGGLLDIGGVQEYLNGQWNNRTLTIAGTRKDFVQIHNQRSDSGFGGQYVRASSGTPICTLNAEL